jgi:hypothetical protein
MESELLEGCPPWAMKVEFWFSLSKLDKDLACFYSYFDQDVKSDLEKMKGGDGYGCQCPVAGCSVACDSNEELYVHLLQKDKHTSQRINTSQWIHLFDPSKRVVICLTGPALSSGEISNAAPGSSDIYIIYFVALIILFMSLCI